MNSHRSRVSFEVFFREHYWPLVRALSVAWRDSEAAHDAVAEAFARAAARWDDSRVRPVDPVAWVRLVAVNLLRDGYRRERVAQRLLPKVAVRGASGDFTAQSEARIDVGRALALLPEGQRLSVALYYLADLSVAEVAAALGIARGTVKRYLHEARASLLEHMEVPS